MQLSLRSAALMISIVGGAALAGGIYGNGIGSARAASNVDASEGDANELHALIQVIQREYASEVEVEDLVFDGAIPTMLQRLDPHSQFFDPKALERLREDQRGNYAGIGMQISPFEGRVVVDHPFPNTPAFDAGLRPEDVILEIDGKSATDWTVDEVAKTVRGSAGTSVHVSLEREGYDQPVETDVIRARITRPSVPLHFELEPGVGYIRITSFMETTGREVDQALYAFKKKGLDALVLDLRDNRGGLLSTGVHVADRFLAKGQAIVSHRGRASKKKSYDSRRGHEGELFPMVVMVNCNSASAAEIVAGALQDHDRALIVGQSTFGKGLVQSVFDLSHTTGLVLTTARYYTPTGRLIQRPYHNVSLYDYYQNPCSSSYKPELLETKLTDAGRQVYGGGGIMPDVPLAYSDGGEARLRLVSRRAFRRFARDYVYAHPETGRDWEPSEAVIEEFWGKLPDYGVSLRRTEFESEMDYVLRTLRRQVFTARFDLDEGSRAEAEVDVAVHRAMALISQARSLLEYPSSELAQRQFED